MIVEDFIGIEKNLFSSEYCENIIKNFNILEKQGYTMSRQDLNDGSPLHKNDVSIDTVLTSSNTYPTNTYPADALSDGLGKEFLDVFWKQYDIYVSQIPSLAQIKNEVHIRVNKCQKTRVGEGYHIWHCESSNPVHHNRLFAYIFYLNNVDEGGETEFLHQHKRIKPEQGTLVIFPGHFTHTHRGNPPLSNTKYILTGWVEF